MCFGGIGDKVDNICMPTQLSPGISNSCQKVFRILLLQLQHDFESMERTSSDRKAERPAPDKNTIRHCYVQMKVIIPAKAGHACMAATPREMFREEKKKKFEVGTVQSRAGSSWYLSSPFREVYVCMYSMKSHAPKGSSFPPRALNTHPMSVYFIKRTTV